MPTPPSGDDLRRWAAMCAARAKITTSDEERDRLQRMERAMLDLAANQDWLDGKAQSEIDPPPTLRPNK